MQRDIITYAIIFIVLVLAQVLICNHIALFNVAIPFIFIFFILRMPMNMSLNLLYTFSFLLGFLIDVFSDTPGINSLACVILAAVKRPVFFAYVPRDDRTTSVVPGMASLGWAVYTKYALSMTAIYCLLVFSIEYFSFASVKDILIMTVSSTLLSFVLLLALDSLIFNRRERL